MRQHFLPGKINTKPALLKLDKTLREILEQHPAITMVAEP
jgi:hypothetical protein